MDCGTEQSRHNARQAWRARKRVGAFRGSDRRVSRGAEGTDAASARRWEWAATQNNSAMRSPGSRSAITSPASLDEAVAAYREALKERTRERAPLEWAATQSDLGIALARLGQREEKPGHLEEAVAAFREALKERTRERAPRRMGGDEERSRHHARPARRTREQVRGRFEEVIAAYREALKGRMRERAPPRMGGDRTIPAMPSPGSAERDNKHGKVSMRRSRPIARR